MRIMALDVGDKKIGVAVSDSLLNIAQPRPTLQRKDLQSDLSRLRELAEGDDVQQIVVGNPVHMDGRESRQSNKVQRFARQVSKALGLPVVFWDERLTSFAAEQQLEELGMSWRKRRQYVDQVAAILILQSYLDSQKI